MKLLGFISLLVISQSYAYYEWPISQSKSFIKGVVYWDRNENGIHEDYEPGIPDVCVSNGKEVVKTDYRGNYILPTYERMTIMVTNPVGFTSPLDKNNIPQFFYIHQPKGSPPEIAQFPGLEPTGPLPSSVDFPLVRSKYSKKFKMIITGDTQVYSDQEIDFLRESIVKELAENNYGAAGIICLGDNIGDKLSLYPRYLSVMSKMGLPLWLVPGNHDLNYDAMTPENSFETFKREFGPTYYSFNHGYVHFVVLNSVVYPSPYSSRKDYQGEIDSIQMEWLKNDLSFVPMNHLIVLSMHIPIISYVDRNTEQSQVKNREKLYDLIKGRNVISLGGHTHTLDHFMPGEQFEGWGQQTPIRQISVGAACGSWWSGDLDENGVPMSYQRCGAPKGYMIFEFNGNTYNDQYKVVGKSLYEQMHISFKTESFDKWYNQLWSWLNSPVETRDSTPPVTINDLPDQKTISRNELEKTKLVANIWNSSRDSKVIVKFDNGDRMYPERSMDTYDPYVLRLQSYVFRYIAGFQLFNNEQSGPSAPQPLDAWIHARSSNHIWVCDLPRNLKSGSHTAKVITKDVNGNQYKQTIVFEVVE